ncbi:MAG: T9SS type A sorting domain-containing protein [Bacteroidia bacterium]
MAKRIFKVFISIVVLTNLAYGQCINLPDTVLSFSFQKELVIDFELILEAEAKVNESIAVSIDTDNRHYKFDGIELKERDSFKVTLMLGPYAKGIYESVLRRQYRIEGVSSRICVDTIKIDIINNPDPRFDSIGNGNLKVGTGAGHVLFAESRKGLFKKDGFGLEFFGGLSGGNSLWVGGIGQDSKLYVSGANYMMVGFEEDTTPYESSFGPAEISSKDAKEFNRVFKLTRNNIYSESAIWPVEYKDSNGIQKQLMPFVDIDADNSWDASKDVACLFGDKMLFTSYHFKENEASLYHDGMQMPVMVNQYMMLYDDESLKDVLFVKLEITNSGQQVFDSVYVGVSSELTQGWYMGNYVGCDTNNHLLYSYLPKGSSPEFEYNNKEAALGIVFLNQELDNFIPYHKDPFNRCTGFIRSRQNQYFYLSGRGQYGDPYYDHELKCADTLSGKKTTRLYPGNPFDTTETGGVTMRNLNSQLLRYYGIGSFGPVTLKPGQTETLDMAWIVGFNGSNTGLENLETVFAATKKAKEFYGEKGFRCLSKEELSIEKAQGPSFSIYPNPTSGAVNIKSENEGMLKVYTTTGSLLSIQSISAGNSQLGLNLPKGIYLIELTTDKGIRTEKLTID